MLSIDGAFIILIPEEIKMKKSLGFPSLYLASAFTFTDTKNLIEMSGKTVSSSDYCSGTVYSYQENNPSCRNDQY